MEDEQSIAKLIKEELKSLDIEIEIVLNGSIAIEKIKSHKPDLILLDLLLPGKPGLEILKEVRESKDLKHIPVIILSNFNDPSHIDPAFKLGISDYLIKVDHTLEEVVSAVKKVLES